MVSTLQYIFVGDVHSGRMATVQRWARTSGLYVSKWILQHLDGTAYRQQVLHCVYTQLRCSSRWCKQYHNGRDRTTSYITSRKRKRSDGSMTKCSYQSRCIVSKWLAKSKHVCSHCTYDTSKDVWICHSSTGGDCFRQHLRTNHVDMDLKFVVLDIRMRA